jgi:nucleotide-binding universal stress UspA family protein
MGATETNAPVRVKNILYLTDFSEPSEAALPFATTLARGCGAKVHALHVLVPAAYVYMTPGLTAVAIEAAEENAWTEMQRVESQLAGLVHRTFVERGVEVWPAVRRAIEDDDIDLVVLGTHGRTGAEKLLLGSVAEEIFRRSPVPVLTIGPGVRSGVHNGGRFRRVLFATDFTPESLAGTPYAVALAEENQARLLLLLVMRKPSSFNQRDKKLFEMSVAEAMLHYVFPTCEDARIDTKHPHAANIDATEPIKSWRTAWRRALKDAKLEIRFHDLRHCCITKLAESHASEQAIMAIAGHLSRAMVEQYSHIRMAAKRVALEGIAMQAQAADFRTDVNQNVHQPADDSSGALSNSMN